MLRRAFLLTLLSFLTMAASSCRSRRPVPPPQPAPPVEAAAAPEPAVPVQPPDRDFPQPPPDPGDGLSEVVVLHDAFFAFDAATLDGEAQQALQQSAAWLREHPEFRVRVEGHCDERGTEQYNLALGDRRAESAASYLTSLGVDRARIEAVSYGEERPFEEGSTEAAWAQNRRAHLVVAGPR